MAINPMDAIGGMGPVQSSAKTQSSPSGFGEILRKSIDSVSQEKGKAEELASGLLSGQHANIHETMIALEKANIKFRMLTKVQNKVVNAYQEIMRMQL